MEAVALQLSETLAVVAENYAVAEVSSELAV